MMKKCLLVFALLSSMAYSDWKAADCPLMTKWGEGVTPENAWQEYPRPQMVRNEWLNLNGLWDYTLEPVNFTPVQGFIKEESMTSGQIPSEWTGKILVPFAIDAPLSGVMHVLRPTERVWYRNKVTIPKKWDGSNVLMHIQAADWETSVYVNGKRVGQHRGGYDPFTFDITDALKKGDNEVVLCCWDGMDKHCQVLGKQILPEERYGFRYQPTGGIWQTVWLEPVPANGISNIKILPDPDNQKILLNVDCYKNEPLTIEAVVIDGSKEIARSISFAGQLVHVSVPNPVLWFPENPHLYDIKVTLKKDGLIVDEISSYFGMRKIEIKKAHDGFTRIHLNDKPIFQLGPLDQGYWPDGILTPPSDDAAKYDLEYLKSIGCNMVRVHIKTHPERWYYWADRLGLLVWQDMICTPKLKQTVDVAAANQRRIEFESIIDSLYNHPSIVQWVVFNEAWGQYKTVENTKWTMQKDPSRIIAAASGWTNFPVGDTFDEHDYGFYPSVTSFKDAKGQAIVLGELGGHNLYVPGHTWYKDIKPESNYTYVKEGGRATFLDGDDWKDPYEFFWQSVRCLNAGAGLNAAIYTQITDVEHECNGWLTYDRKVSKIPADTLKKIHQRLYQPPVLKDILTDYTFKYNAKAVAELAGNKKEPDISGPWQQIELDDSKWESAVVSTIDIAGSTGDRKVFAMRKRFDFDTSCQKPVFYIALKRTDTGAKPAEINDGFMERSSIDYTVNIYLNGTLLRKAVIHALDGHTAISYLPLHPSEVTRFKQKDNLLSIAVNNSDSIQTIDIKLQQMVETN